jgi:uncharacterized protein
MRIAFHDIIEPLSLPVSDDGWFPRSEIEPVSPVEGQLSVSRRSDDQAVVRGSFTVGVTFPCDRCCQPAALELEAEFEYDCIVGKEDPRSGDDTECREEDYYRLYLHEPVIDLGEILKEQVYLAMPVSVQCRKSCKGLCHQCGTDLNVAECSCTSSDPSSPFAVLRQLKGH